MEQKIKTKFVYPPIPWRGNDWAAWVDGQEEDGPYGWGETEKSAVENLQSQLEESEIVSRCEHGIADYGYCAECKECEEYERSRNEAMREDEQDRRREEVVLRQIERNYEPE